MNAAARAWAEVASEAACAVVLLHHARKGTAGQARDIESSRGGNALADASRVGLTLAAMTPDEANQCDVALDERWRHIRLDDGKQSMAARADKARWLRLVGVALGNSTTTYPNGDSVQAIETWAPPTAFGDLSVRDINAVLDLIEQGSGDGRRYTSSKAGRGGAPRWAGHLLVEHLGRNDAQAKAMLKTWLETGLLVERDYHDPDQRKDMPGLFVDAARRPGLEPGA